MYIFFYVFLAIPGDAPDIEFLMYRPNPYTTVYQQFYSRAACEKAALKPLAMFPMIHPEGEMQEHGCVHLKEKWV